MRVPPPHYCEMSVIFPCTFGPVLRTTTLYNLIFCLACLPQGKVREGLFGMESGEMERGRRHCVKKKYGWMSVN